MPWESGGVKEEVLIKYLHEWTNVDEKKKDTSGLSSISLPAALPKGQPAEAHGGDYVHILRAKRGSFRS